MAHTLEDFVGTFTIRHGQGRFGVVDVGDRLLIGTGEHGAAPPDGIRVGVAIVDPDGQPVLPAAGDLPAFAYLVEGTLNGSTYWQVDERLELMTYQISLLTMRLRDGSLYRAPTLMVTIGDPQNAGVWGADDDGG